MAQRYFSNVCGVKTLNIFSAIPADLEKRNSITRNEIENKKNNNSHKCGNSKDHAIYTPGIKTTVAAATFVA